MTIVRVVWNDAWQGGHDEFTEKQARKQHSAFEQTSVGYEIVQDKVGITLAGCHDAAGVYHRVMFIPRGMIKSVQVLA